MAPMAAETFGPEECPSRDAAAPEATEPPFLWVPRPVKRLERCEMKMKYDRGMSLSFQLFQVRVELLHGLLLPWCC